MDFFRRRQASDSRRSGEKEHSWHEELPVPARLAMFSAWATLVGSLIFTGLSWHFGRQDVERQTRQRFELRVSEIETAVFNRLQAQEQVLRGARGLFEASREVSREEWRSYVAALNLERNYPGIQGIGFAKYVTLGELDSHTRAVRREGFPDYSVSPPGNRAEYTPILYLEPFNWRNRRAFGFDMFFEPTRREAMETARDTGQPTITGKVTLVQETDEDVQAGFLLYLPLYRLGTPTATVAQRRAALAGYIYSPFRMGNLMAGIVGRDLPDINLKIYDGPATEANLMYDSHAGQGTSQPSGPELTVARAMEVGGRSWTLQVSALPGFEDEAAAERPRLILQAGTLISLLMFGVVWSLATLRRRALVLAADMTAALRESREHFRAVSETASDPIVSSDAIGRITYLNQAAERVFGYSREEALGQPVSIIIPERLQAAHTESMRRFLNGGEARIIGKTMAMVARRKDGSEFPIEISVASWTTSEGISFTAIIRDISQRVEAEERIRELNRELQGRVDQLAEVNQDLESFSYSVSHDLRAPLRAINGFGRILEESRGPALDPEGQRLLRIILESSRKMGQLIDDLLAFARLGQTSVSQARVDMGQLAREVVDEICLSDDCKAIRFSIGTLPPARGDRALLRQVWMNLISNAVKFSRTRPEPHIEADCREEGKETIYIVRDNGVGFDMAKAGQLFGVFKRLHKADQFPGTGVGLAIVHRIVTRHGGRVWAESEADKGATFYFALPRCDFPA